jgi:hypothetical protein
MSTKDIIILISYDTLWYFLMDLSLERKGGFDE